MEEFRFNSLPEELQYLVAEDVAKNSFVDIFRLRITSKYMKEIILRSRVYVLFNVFNWTWQIPRHVGIEEECYAHMNSMLYLKGTQFFFLYGFEEEGLALMKTAADKSFEIALYTYAMIHKAFWDNEEYFFRFNRKNIRRISMKVKDKGWGLGWPPNATALLRKRDEFMTLVLPSYYACKCTSYDLWSRWHDDYSKGPDMCHRCFCTR